jgi:hypothetical protein
MKSIPLTRGLVTIADDADYEFLSQWKWYALKCKAGFYAVRTEQVGKTRRVVMMHRLLLGATGKSIVDHRNRVTLDNQRDNLRISDQTGNNANARLRKNNTCGYKGVYWDSQSQVWRGELRKKGVRMIRGSGFPTPLEAALAYDAAAIAHFGEFALTNRQLGLLP